MWRIGRLPSILTLNDVVKSYYFDSLMPSDKILNLKLHLLCREGKRLL